MSNANNTAYPFSGAGTEGLTKREYFAAMAMQGVIASYCKEIETPAEYDYIAMHAVDITDALLSELDRAR